MELQQTHAKEPTKIQITSNKTQYEGGKLSIKLTNLNKTALSKEIVNITITDEKGKIVVDDVVKTNKNGKAKLDLNLEAGEYTVNVSYGGNENFTGNSTTQNLTIEQEVVETNTETSSSQTQSSGESGESVVVESVDKESGVVEGYKRGRKGVWTPTGNFIAEGVS